jgi:Family of unknown function (DUF5908)
MPIVLEELLIKARVEESESTPPAENNNSPSHTEDASIKQIDKAVREIMDMLKRKNER